MHKKLLVLKLQLYICLILTETCNHVVEISIYMFFNLVEFVPNSGSIFNGDPARPRVRPPPPRPLPTPIVSRERAKSSARRCSLACSLSLCRSSPVVELWVEAILFLVDVTNY